MRRLRSHDGFTLVETIVAVALIVTVVAVMGPVMTSALSSTRVVRDQSSAIDEVRIAVDRIDKELRSACKVTSPTVGAQGSSLAFTTRNSSGALDDIVYSIGNGRLERRLNGGAPQYVSEGLVVTNQEFTHDVNGTGTRAEIAISLQVSYSGGSPRLLSTTIAGRNTWSGCV